MDMNVKTNKIDDMIDDIKLRANVINYAVASIVGLVSAIIAICKAVEAYKVIEIKRDDPDSYYSNKYEGIIRNGKK